MKGKKILIGIGLLMIAISLRALAADTHRYLDAQCSKRCNCTAAPCGAITKCQDNRGLWTKCCQWCVL